MPRKSLLLALPLALVAGLSTAPTAGSAPVARASLHAASATLFTDAAGDSGAAADVTEVLVGNDLVAGHLVFWVTVANRPNDLVAGDEVIVYFDADNNPSTGDAGSEYAIRVGTNTVGEEVIGASRWDGTQYAPVDLGSLSVRFFSADRALRVSVHPNDVGVTTAFNFAVETSSGDSHDAAPNGAPAWPYTLATGPLQLTVRQTVLQPKRPTAGKRLALALTIVRADIFEFLDQGKVTCTLKAGTKSVRASESRYLRFDRYALCGWKLPKSTKGKLLRGTISVTFGGTTVKRSFSARAR